MNKTGLPSHMYFIALLCPDAVNEEVKRYKQYLFDHFGCRAALKSPAHITLVAPFWLEEERENGLREALSAFRSDMPGLEIRLEGFSHFDRRVLFIAVKENAALTELQAQVQDHFLRLYPRAIRPDRRAFHPHVTLATRDLYPAQWEQAWTQFGAKTYAASFPTERLSLLKLSEGHWLPIAESHWSESGK